MVSIENKTEVQSREVEADLRKSEHWSNFGTLTSLLSSGALFFETAFGKNLPRWVHTTTFGSVGVGIVGVLASYYYKLKAARIALYSPAHAAPKIYCEMLPREDPGAVENKPMKSWAEKEDQMRQVQQASPVRS